ncbi:MAG: hypothetical protein COV62_01540 [Candidatus Nealsonbacteria bacterium CG11_big_fil_rev_8_21_14_0_20_35_11]|uniref:HAD family hydrolase n=1 Tax=Candidatus Nealsonbacteria bacterium CG11_big_fil_rev_8_21_14_0_20_35_11 TaxID=1974713 RepID=A0A2H0N0N6_9BACT|nr:MAG: hypothetical protein COV62_01540 [Candidatus Nealsonbacteria bacterium CG11_big_fil_rev_8_21_14_0_20_35_11]
MKLKLIIFDFYKTLGFQVSKIELKDFFVFYKKIGVEFKTEEDIKAFTLLFSELIGCSANWLELGKNLLEKVLEKPSPEKIKALADFYKENIVYQLYDDVKEIINLPYRKAVLTANAKFLIKKLGLEKFAKLFTPRETKFLKPDPKAFLAVLENLKVKPEETIMVGDEIERDLIPAQNLGMKTILIDRGNKIEDSPFKKISSLAELKNLLEPVV